MKRASITNKKSGNKGAPYWWTNDIAEIRKKCLAVRRVLTRMGKHQQISNERVEETTLEYRTLRKELKNNISRSKKEK